MREMRNKIWNKRGRIQRRDRMSDTLRIFLIAMGALLLQILWLGSRWRAYRVAMREARRLLVRSGLIGRRM